MDLDKTSGTKIFGNLRMKRHGLKTTSTNYRGLLISLKIVVSFKGNWTDMTNLQYCKIQTEI
jgi:hypothetical protein